MTQTFDSVTPPVTPPVQPTTPVTPPVEPPPPVSPVPPTTPVAEPVPPTPTPTYTPPANPPSNKSHFYLAFILMLALISIAAFFIFRSNSKTSNTSPNQKASTPFDSPATKLEKSFTIDTDGDFIPDNIESELSLDPNISEINRCKATSCETSDLAKAKRQNILIILDSSGSMNAKIGMETKMDMAKAAIRSFAAKSSANTNIGLMIYGHKGSNSESDKALSCASAEIVSQIGSLNSSTAESYLSSIKPVGWTPIGLAIENAKAAFAGKEADNNQIIIVSDGNETCGTDPASKAASAYASSAKIQVNVIGFAVASSEHAALQAISTSGGGSFKTANSTTELEDEFETRHKNFENFQSDATCLVKSSTESYECLDKVKSSFQQYLYAKTDENVSDGPIYNVYSNLSTKLNEYYNDTIDAVLNSSTDKINERKDTLIGQ